MDYISGAGAPQSTNKGYFRKMAYPDYYKVSEMSITKFERNIRGEQLKYTFINAFPKSMTAIPVAYGAADLLKVTVSFNYDRYIMDRKNEELSAAADDAARSKEDMFKILNGGLETVIDENTKL